MLLFLMVYNPSDIVGMLVSVIFAGDWKLDTLLFLYALQDTQLNLVLFHCRPIVLLMKCCWYWKCQIFCTSRHFLMFFYFLFSILMIVWYIDKKQVLFVTNFGYTNQQWGKLLCEILNKSIAKYIPWILGHA